MTDYPARTTSRLEPETAWTVMTEAPLKGLGLAREAGTVLAWDETDQLYLINLGGEYCSVARAPGKVLSAAISDDGSRVAILGEGPRLRLLDADLGVVADRPAPPDPLAMAIDPHGRFVVISSRLGMSNFYNRFGKPAGRFDAVTPLAFLVFLADQPILICAAAYGMMAAYELSGTISGKLKAERLWEERQVAGVGRLTTTGDGSMILASCFTHGVQRYDVNGGNDGAYHLGGTATHAVPDFAGRTIAVATLEGELVILNSAGNIRWKTGLSRPAIALETDPLGRYLILGNATGEVCRLDLFPADRPEGAPRPARATTATARGEAPGVVRTPGGTIRKPDWTLPVAISDDQAETAVLAVLDQPPRVGLFMSNLRLRIVATDGRDLGFAPEILGVGRILRTAPGWIAAATDRQIVLFHAAKDAAQRIQLSMVEITHLAISPDSFGLVVVQERDRVGRATISGRWIWKHELKSAIEDLAIGPDGFSAVTNDAGALTIFDPAGITAGTYSADPAEPLSLIDAVDDAQAGVVWMTLARRSQVLRGHELRGRVIWESPVAFEGWQLHRQGPIAMVTAPDGRAQAFDGAGHLRGQGRGTGGGKDLFGVTRSGEPRRISHQDVHLICSDLDGRVRWRAVCNEQVGPVAIGRRGVAALIGRSLAWFEGLE
jgi:hypothetical protein